MMHCKEHKTFSMAYDDHLNDLKRREGGVCTTCQVKYGILLCSSPATMITSVTLSHFFFLVQLRSNRCKLYSKICVISGVETHPRYVNVISIFF